tara:strand:- start:50 stop:1129 length:1080 start_codon:yes stop_codon:yes gene_type:complete
MSGRTSFGLFGKNIKKNNDKSYIKSIPIGKIKSHYENNDLIIPEFQRELDKSKISEMIRNMKSLDKIKTFSSMVNPIQLATIKIKDNKFRHLVIDGQHRLMALIFLKDKMNEICFEFHVQICENEKEAIKKFKTCIKGQENNYLISKEILNEHFRESIPFRFKNYLKKEYEKFFSKSQNDRCYYNLDLYLIKLKEKEFFTMSDSYKLLLKYFTKKNKEFLEKEYKILLNKGITDIFYKKELFAINNNVAFSLKKNNFIDFLIYGEDKTVHIYKKSKKKIPQKLRIKVWNNFSKRKIKTCPISFCDEKISINNFHCGHIKSEYNGGLLESANLIPLCKNCNLKISSKNIKQFDCEIKIKN